MSSDRPPPDRSQQPTDPVDQAAAASIKEETPVGSDSIENYGVGSGRSLAGRVSWALVAEIANAVIALAMFFVLYFVTIGTVGYGTFAAVIAIAAIVGPVSSFGANWLLIKEAVVSNDIRSDLGRAIARSTVGNVSAVIVVTLVFLAIPGWFDTTNRVTIFLLLIGQVPAYFMIELAVTACVAQAKLKLGAQLRLISSGIRLLALIAFAVSSTRSLDAWAWYFAGSGMVSALVLHGVLASINGGLPRLPVPSVKDLAYGFPYGLGNTTEGLLNQSDKPILEQNKEQAIAGSPEFEASGDYSAGYRIMSLGLIPLQALLRAQDRRFFRQGAGGSASTHIAASKMSVLALGATVPVTVVLATAAWFVPPMLSLLPIGADLVTEEKLSVPLTVVRYVSVVPILKGFQFSFGNSLTAAGNQTSRMLVTALAVLGNLSLNLRYIPEGSWRAAAATTIGAEIFLAIALAAASWYYARKASRSNSLEASDS